MSRRLCTLVATLALLGACASAPTATREPEGSEPPQEQGAAAPQMPERLAHINYTGGDGSSCAAAVVIHGAANTPEGIGAENVWILWRYPGAQKTGQSLVQEDGGLFDLIEVTTAEGEEVEVCFDISGFFGKW